tara:strand:+ start:1021 stop:1134 length:114 start_codon:yes stop_codon:yes gene_type:complete
MIPKVITDKEDNEKKDNFEYRKIKIRVKRIAKNPFLD